MLQMKHNFKTHTSALYTHVELWGIFICMGNVYMDLFVSNDTLK
jgi:hypothetical protein